MKRWGVGIVFTLLAVVCRGGDEPIYIVLGDLNEIIAKTRFQDWNPRNIPVENGRISCPINDDGTYDESSLFLEVDLRMFSQFHEKFNTPCLVVIIRFGTHGIRLQTLYDAFYEEKRALHLWGELCAYEGNPFTQRVEQERGYQRIVIFADKIWDWANAQAQEILAPQLEKYLNCYKKGDLPRPYCECSHAMFSFSELVTEAIEQNYVCDERALVEYGLDHELLSIHDSTLLLRAAYAGKENVIDLLLERGANASAIDEGGKNAMMHAHTSPHYKHDEAKRERITTILRRSGSPSIWLTPCDGSSDDTSSMHSTPEFGPVSLSPLCDIISLSDDEDNL